MQISPGDNKNGVKLDIYEFSQKIKRYRVEQVYKVQGQNGWFCWTGLKGTGTSLYNWW